jgi:hypothetical protein
VRVLDLAPMQLADETLLLRIEISKTLTGPRAFTAKLWRIERYRIQSTFPQKNGAPAHQPSDEELLMVENNFPFDPVTAKSSEAALAKMLRALKRFVGCDSPLKLHKTKPPRRTSR